MKWLYAAAAALLIGIAGSADAWADDITADVLTYNGETKIATAQGNVVIHTDGGATMTGASGEYHFDGGAAFLTGGVHYEKGAQVMDAETLHVAGDKTITGTGSVAVYDGETQRTIKGDTVTYNSESGYSKVEGNGFVASPDGSLAAPEIEGNVKAIHLTASGGVQFWSETHQLTGSGDQAVYTKSPDADDGRVVLTGNAEATQNGNSFYGPELVFTLSDNSVKTNGRSRLVITNSSGV